LRATRRHARPVRVLLVFAAAASGLGLGPTAPPTQALPTQEEPTLPHAGDVAADVDVFKADDGDVVDALNNLHGNLRTELRGAGDRTLAAGHRPGPEGQGRPGGGGHPGAHRRPDRAERRRRGRRLHEPARRHRPRRDWRGIDRRRVPQGVDRRDAARRGRVDPRPPPRRARGPRCPQGGTGRRRTACGRHGRRGCRRPPGPGGGAVPGGGVRAGGAGTPGPEPRRGRGAGRGSACFGWLQGHATGYGLHNLPSEPWHWSVDGS
jgi:hypothetical protein